MLRLSTPGYRRIVQSDSFDLSYAGGEANVAASLAIFGLNSHFVTKVPNNAIGQSAINHLRKYGVHTDYITIGGKRLGVYFLETGASQRPSTVLYDREHSAISEINTSEFNWKDIFADATWFHVTGITPALSDRAAETTLEACREAKNAGVTVSCDLNYRKKLWTKNKASQVMSKLMQYVDIVVGNEEDAEDVFGITAKGIDVEKGVLNEQSYKEVASQLLEKFNLKAVAITLRESHSASDNTWSGLLYDGEEFYRSRQYKIHIVDRVGGGDSFAAGMIYGYMQKWHAKDIVEYAAAASCLKQSIPGDFNLVSVDEVKKLAEGATSGRVQR